MGSTATKRHKETWIALLAALSLLSAVGRAGPGGSVLTGRVLDPLGLGIPGAAITVVEVATGASRTAVTDRAGTYRFTDLPPGAYHLEAAFQGFAPHSAQITMTGEPQVEDVRLQIQATKESVTVATPAPQVYAPLATSRHETGDVDRARSGNAAELLSDSPGLDLQQSGSIATIPLLHGLGDERTKLLVNGMTLSSACPNHMNPPFSYIDPSNVAKAYVTAGITPVSLGGDSITGTVSVDSAPPVFAKSAGEWHAEGVLSSFYRSNGAGYGAALTGAVSNRNLSFGYSGAWDNTGDYHDGSGQKVTSTYAQTTNNSASFAAQGAGNLIVVEAGLHNTPYQGFPNQQMDMTGNRGEFVNVHYRRDLHWAVLEARGYWQNVRHGMNVGKDKSTFPMPMWMPMDTHGRDLGYSIRLQLPLSERHTLQVGNEFHRFALDDVWPPVPGTEPYMGPNEFVVVNGGHRVRLGSFADASSKWTAKWTTLVGIRSDAVWTNAGPVSGYSDTMMYAPDAAAFNAQRHARTDVNFDLTALARYQPGRAVSFEAGYARKTRTPNLYERYAWSKNWMASGMINWFGDGNYYVGNLSLEPDVAHTVSGTAGFHDPVHERWELKVTPYWTRIRDYVGVNQVATSTYGESTFAQLQFANQNARIYGVDLAGDVSLWDSATLGRATIRGVAGWRRGTVLTTNTGTYHIMPPNTRLTLDETLRACTVAVELELADRKSRVDPVRFEQPTSGYALLGLRTGYRWRRLGVEAGVRNLLNRYYYLPLGGVNFDAYMVSGWSGRIMPLAGPGRSIFTGVAIHF